MSNFLVWLGFTLLMDQLGNSDVIQRSWLIVGVLSVVIDVIRVARSLIVEKKGLTHE